MKYTLAALALAAAMSSPLHAQDKMSMDPSCSDYMGMDSEGQMGAMTEMGDQMKAEGMASTDPMSADDMMAQAGTACAAHPDGSVGEAMKMMEGS